MINTVKKLYFNSNFTSYEMTLLDGKKIIVPVNEANTDYQNIQEWAAIEGNNIIDPGA